ncbi:MAG: hypothetical protein K6C94_01315 [Candidatus Gastranaerophilales bacterium]|nr:hypothetical protein [Candidatus Gastranaerophilales bacterium]
MDIIEADKELYSKTVLNPFCKFETAEFADLNKAKADEVKYFIFNNGKNRFGLIAGIKDGVMKLPFSASFSCLSEITTKNRIEYYVEAAQALVDYAKAHSLSKIIFNTPPIYYNVEHISKLHNALLNVGFEQKEYNLNFEFYLSDFGEDYLASIQRNARKNYNTAVRNNLVFEKTDDIETVYKVIKRNRDEKGYPLWMSIDDIVETSKIIPSDYFLVKTPDGVPIAAAFTHDIDGKNIRVNYWGDIREYEEMRPINFLSYNLFRYYKEQGKYTVDIGPSTNSGIADFGLCNFKESLGCKASAKLLFEYMISD